jgi:hypothetical protein
MLQINAARLLFRAVDQRGVCTHKPIILVQSKERVLCPSARNFLLKHMQRSLYNVRAAEHFWTLHRSERRDVKLGNVRGEIDTGQAMAISATRSPVAVAHEEGAFRAQKAQMSGV